MAPRRAGFEFLIRSYECPSSKNGCGDDPGDKGKPMRPHYLPVLVLLFLSPVVGELFLGATTVSRLATAIPLIFFYGGGAVIIRELARRHGAGWGRIVILAMAYGIIEEGLATQTLFNPELFRAGEIGGRALGVNWVWSEWTVGYHVVYSIAIPILLAELLFPAVRNEPWLGWKALVSVCVGYLASAVVIGMAFRQIIAPDFRTPMPQVVAAVAVVIGLGALAMVWPNRHRERRSGRFWAGVPSPWVLGVFAFLAAFAWFLLLALPSALKTGLPVLGPLVGGVVLSAGVVELLGRWASLGEGWTRRHQLALVMGSLPPVMLFGFFIVTASQRVDQVGQGIISLAAMGGLALLAGRLRLEERRGAESDGTGVPVSFAEVVRAESVHAGTLGNRS
jgi:hypothetical protein